MTQQKQRPEGPSQAADAAQPPRDPRETSAGGVKGRIGAADESDARLPHERDESPGNAADAPRGEGQKAYEDARRGMPDTDKAPAMDATYQRLRKDAPKP